MADARIKYRCKLSTTVHYTRRDGRASSVYFSREITLPFKPSVGDLLLLDDRPRGDPPAPGFSVDGVLWSASEPTRLRLTSDSWYFQPPNCFHLPFGSSSVNLISFRLVLGLIRIGFEATDEWGDDELIEQCREAEKAWAAAKEESEDA